MLLVNPHWSYRQSALRRFAAIAMTDDQAINIAAKGSQKVTPNVDYNLPQYYKTL